jgi:hypothetical protein
MAQLRFNQLPFKRRLLMKRANILSLGLALLLLPAVIHGSDHADPMNLDPKEQEANITGLFFFPDGDQMIAILNIRRSLTAPPPYNLDPFEYDIYMDLHSKVTYDNAEDRARYGGTIANPEGINPDVTIKIRLNNDTTIKEKSYEGLKNLENIILYTGVRDDPFIFPRFFNVNIITMALSIPKSSFPENQQNWLLWATSRRIADGTQIDHVGRSNRTQLGRFDFLNTLPPNQHVAAIKEKATSREKLQQFLKDCFPPLANLNQLSGLVIRHYDYVPDVMVYTNQLPSGFPNGRRLTDDVALLTCQQGDCPLQENAFIDTKQWPRATVNDKPLMDKFPYLAEPWPAKPQAPAGSCWPYIMEYVVVPVMVVLAIVIGLIIWRRRKRARG